MEPLDFHVLVESLKVEPENYSKPVRFYSDVDGVSVLQFETMEAREAHNPHTNVEMLMVGYGGINKKKLSVEWNAPIAEALAAYSKSSQVDFVWLTSWYWNAPLLLDPLFKIHSLGYLPWGESKSDHNQFFKAVAIAEDQKKNPSAFIWVDDIAATASATAFLEREGVDLSNALIIKTDMVDGLTAREITRIEAFLATQA